MARAPVVVQPLHSAGLEMITEALKGLRLCAPVALTPESGQLLDFDYGRLEHQLGVVLGPQSSREGLLHLTFSITNVMAQLTRGELLSLEYLIQNAPMVLPFGLRNVAETVGHLVEQCMIPSPANNEFMGVIKYIMESFHDLLAEEPESPSGSDSSRGSHHPSRECFMTGTPMDMLKASTRRSYPDEQPR